MRSARVGLLLGFLLLSLPIRSQQTQTTPVQSVASGRRECFSCGRLTPMAAVARGQ